MTESTGMVNEPYFVGDKGKKKTTISATRWDEKKPQRILTPSNDEQAFTLIEKMMALLLFLSVVLSSFFGSLIFMSQRATENEIRGSAIAAAQKVLDKLRPKSPDTLPNNPSAPEVYTVQIRGRKDPFSVEVRYCTMSAMCTASSTRQLQVKVIYLGTERFSVESVFTRVQE